MLEQRRKEEEMLQRKREEQGRVHFKVIRWQQHRSASRIKSSLLSYMSAFKTSVDADFQGQLPEPRMRSLSQENIVLEASEHSVGGAGSRSEFGANDCIEMDALSLNGGNCLSQMQVNLGGLPDDRSDTTLSEHEEDDVEAILKK